MKFTTKSSYGIRALINLALMYDQKKPVPIGRIAKKENISGFYLEQLFNKLKKHGLIRSVRGPRGGYTFSKDPADISVYEAVKMRNVFYFFHYNASLFL